VLDPRRPGAKLSVPLLQTTAGRYEADFRLQRYGAFILQARHKIDGKVVAESVSSLSAPYPKEYTDLIQDRQLLSRAASVSRGRIDPSVPQLFDPGGDKIRFHKDLWPWVIYLILGLFLLDVLLRRVRIFGYRADNL